MKQRTKECPLCRTDGRSRWERRLNDIALLRCDLCGFIYADLPDAVILGENSEYGDDTEERYRQHQTFLDDIWYQAIAKRFTKRLGPRSVLDVGCGNGRLIYHFSRLGWTCCGVDTSPWSVRAAERYNFELFPGTVEDAAPQLGEFDLVVSSSTLEHIAQPVPHIRAIAQVLKIRGAAYFCGMPNYASLAVRLGLSTFHTNHPPGHVSFFTAKTLSRLFEVTEVSFRHMSVHTYGIPELHRVYRVLLEILRGHQVPTTPDGIGQATSLPPEWDAEISGMKKVLARFLLSTVYHSGRIGNAGDKLEALVVK